MSALDPHSHFAADQARTRRLTLKLDVDFRRRVLAGSVTLHLDPSTAEVLDLDAKGLTIHAVRAADGTPVRFELGEDELVLGPRLRLRLPPGAAEVTLEYETSPDAIALQWLEPAQTEGGVHPYLFSQCQAIHARSMVPCQDTPRARVEYRAEVTVPEPLSAVMSAGPAGVRAGARPGTRTFLFEMPQPIPPYLLALAVGELAWRDLSPRARVWSEPANADRAAWEFAGIEDMLTTAERLFGPYQWDRYDMLVLPPSFPYGGMENPRMTFLTPTLLAWDRSLVGVVAHELAHSWTGNLVTNANADHFWLNEGATTWAERRILEALRGEEAAVLAWAIGQKGLEIDLARFGPGSPLTRLRFDLRGVDPDDAYSRIPYEKGARLFVTIERAVGRERFDAFIREYIARFHFTSITSDDFLAFLDEKLPGARAASRADEWIDQTGLPSNAPVFRSKRLEELTSLAEAWPSGTRPSAEQVQAWNADEMLIYLQHLPRVLDAESCAWLDQHLALSGRHNHELLVEWLTIAAGSAYAPAYDRMRRVLARVGRMKYLRPLYTALAGQPRTRDMAREIFASAGPGYHAVARRMVDGILAKAG